MIVYRCSRTGLYFPGDYCENWGKKYGFGLGPEPVSEALVNDYHHKVDHTNQPPMHPVAVCRAQVDCMDVSEEEYEAHKAILVADDPQMIQRAKIMQDKQILKSTELRMRYPDRVVEVETRLGLREPTTPVAE